MLLPAKAAANRSRPHLADARPMRMRPHGTFSVFAEFGCVISFKESRGPKFPRGPSFSLDETELQQSANVAAPARRAAVRPAWHRPGPGPHYPWKPNGLAVRPASTANRSTTRLMRQRSVLRPERSAIAQRAGSSGFTEATVSSASCHSPQSRATVACSKPARRRTGKRGAAFAELSCSMPPASEETPGMLASRVLACRPASFAPRRISRHLFPPPT